MVIADSTIYTNVWDDVRTKLVAASITVDSTSATIGANYNDKYNTRPQVIINPPNKNESMNKFGTEGRKEITVTIDCYYKNSAGIDSLSNQIEVALKANDIAGIDLMELSSDTGIPLTPNTTKLHLKAISAVYLRE